MHSRVDDGFKCIALDEDHDALRERVATMHDHERGLKNAWRVVKIAELSVLVTKCRLQSSPGYAVHVASCQAEPSAQWAGTIACARACVPVPCMPMG